MLINYIGSDEFRQTLNEWLERQHQRQAERLNNNKLLIPQQLRNYQKTLYLATVVDDDFINKANLARARIEDFSLWTKDVVVARAMSKTQTLQQGQYKILISKVIAPRDQVFDLDQFITFMGIPQLALLGFDERNLKKVKDHKGVIASNQLSIARSEYTILEQSNNTTM